MYAGLGLRMHAAQIARDLERPLHDLPIAEARKGLRRPQDAVNRAQVPRPHERGQVGPACRRCSKPLVLGAGADPERGVPSLDHALPATAPERLPVGIVPGPLREPDVTRGEGLVHPPERSRPGAAARIVRAPWRERRHRGPEQQNSSQRPDQHSRGDQPEWNLLRPIAAVK